VGIVAICVSSIINPLAILGIREYKSPTHRQDFRAGPLGRLVKFLGGIPARAAIFLALASIVVFFAGIAVEDELELQTDPIEWVDQDSQVIKDLRVLDEETGSSSEIGMFVQSRDVFDDETVVFLDR